MKILIATGIYPPEIGGPATYSKLLHDELPKHGIEVDVLAFQEVRHLPKAIRHIAYCIKVLWRGRRCDVIFAQDPVSVGWPALFANIILRKPFLVKVVGDHVWEQGVQRSGMTDSLDSFSFSYIRHPYFAFLKILQQFVVRFADYVIVPSNYLKSIITKWHINQDRIKVIHNGFTLPEVTESRDEIRARLGWQEKIIISPGRLVPWKGFKTLIEIMPDILTVFPDVKLVIVGEGPDKQLLEKVIEELNLQESIMLVGRLPHEEMLAYIRAADLFVLNTGYEGLSHILLEAMALETPILTTNVGGNPELIENKISGVLLEYNNKKELYESIIQMLDGTIQTKILTSHAKEKVASFSKEIMLQKLITIFHSLRS